MTSQDKIDELYDALKADGAVNGSRDNFRAYINDDTNSRKLYDALYADGAVTSKDYDEFASKLGIKPSLKDTTTAPDSNPYQAEDKGEIEVIDNDNKPITYSPSTKAIQDSVDNTINYVLKKSNKGIGNPWKVNFGSIDKNNLLDSKNLVRGNDEYNPDTGKLEPTYITSSGNKYTNKVMASSEQKTLDKYIDEQMQYEKEMQHMPSLAESAAKSVGSGFIRAFSGFLDMLQSMSSGLIVEDASSPSGYTKTRSYEESLSDKKDPLNRATSYLNEKAEKLSKEAHPYSGHVGFLDLLWSGQYDKFLQKGIAVAGESLPMTLSALNPYTMVLNGISMAGSNFRQQTIDNPNIPAYKRAAMAIGSAAIEQAVEKWADPFWKYVKRGVSPKQISQEITREAAKNISKRIYKGLGGLVKDAAGEGAEEVVTNFGNDALGELLDVLSGDKDYGLRAQWEETKKNNPEAKLIDLAIEKGKEAVESFVAGAMAGAYTAGATNLSVEAVNYGLGIFKNSVDEETGVIDPVTYEISQSFDDGYAATDNKARIDAYLSSTIAEKKLSEVLDDKTIKALKDNPYETLAGIKDPAESKAALDYLTSKASYDGVIQRIKNDADERADSEKELKKKILHKNGAIHPATLKIKDEKGNNEKAYIIDGNVVMTPDGTMIDAEKSDKTVVVYDPLTNKNVMIDPSSELGILSLDSSLTEEEYDAIVESERQKYIAEQLNNVHGKINITKGSNITLPNGEIAVVLNTDGENITAQTADGKQVQVNRSDLQQIADEENASDYAKRNTEVGIYMLNSNVSLNTDNGTISGKIIAEENEDGLITVETDKPINGKFVNQFTTEQLDKLVAQDQDGKVDGPKDKQDNGVIQGEPSEYSKGLVMTITDEDGSEKQATVVGRVRYENGKFVPDENGNIVEYTVDGELRHDRIDNMKDKVVSHVAPTSTEPQAPETDEERVIRNGIAGVGEGLRNAVNEQAASVRENDINNWLQKPAVAEAMRKYGEGAQIVEEVVQRALADNPNDETKAALGDIMRFESSKQLVRGYISNPQIVQQAEATVQPTDQPNEEPMPMVGSGDKAEPDFIKTTPQRGHRYIYEESGLSREEANQFVENNIEASSKSLEKAKKKSPKIGTNIAKYNKEKAEWERKVSDAQTMLDYWKAVKSEQYKIVSNELEEKSKRDVTAHEKAVAEEQKRQEEELSKREEQKNLGANAVHPAIIGKWESSNKIDGEENEITLANGEKIKGHYVLVESGAATPSHNPNNNFSKNEGFPVDENGNTVNDRDYERDKDAQSITKQMALNYDSRALQSVPVVSNDGVILSGNGRTMAGEIAAKNNTDGAYIEYLQKYPKQFGFTEEQVKSMNHPRVLFVADGNIPYTTENFAKFNAQDMKSQSRTEQSVKLGKTVDDATFVRIIKIINAFDTIGEFYNDVKASTSAISELRDTGAINAMQYAEMFDGEKISEIGKQILENMLVGKAFEKNPDAVRQLSDIPSLRQSVISALSEISNNVGLGADFSLESELAEAINIAYQARKNGYKSGERVSGYARQLNLFQFDDGESVADYTNATILMLADMINDSRVSQLKKVLSLYNTRASDSASGQMDIFSGGVKTKEEIIKEVLNILNYGTKEEQGKAISESVNKRKAASIQQDGTPPAVDGGSENAGRSERGTEETQTLTHDEAISLIAIMEERANVAPEVELTIENWDALFGEDGRVVTPIGEVKMGENQFTKLMRQGREGKLGMVKPTLETPDVIIEDASEAKDDDVSERKSSYIFVKAFKKADGSRYYYFTSVTVSKDGKEVVISNQEKRKNAIANLLTNGKLVWKHADDVSAASDVEQGLYSSQGNMSDPTTEGTDAPQTNVLPASKGSENSEAVQEKTVKITENQEPNSVQTALAAAEKETNTEPTEAQKEAGNYKKGHLKIDGFDVSIENPKGSVRSGTDASGNKWDQTMNNSYGYIRGTEGVDGDHIDVFLSDDPSRGDVFVVDQVNKDGSFDEHKVMYGFPDIESAKKAYLSNYEEGWQGLGAITPVSKEEFKKWVQSSHRKTKPFAEYRSVNHLGDTQLGEQTTASYSIEPTTYTNKKGKTTPMYLVTFGRELSKDEIRAGKELAKESRSWWDRDKGGFMMRDEDSAKSLAEALSNDEAVSDAQPVSMTDIQALNNGDMLFTEPKQTNQKDIDDKYPVWQYNIYVDKETGRTTLSRDDVSSGYPIGDARFRKTTDTPEEMLDILRNPLNGMQEILEEVGVTLENKIKTRELNRKSKEQAQTSNNNTSGNSLVIDERYVEENNIDKPADAGTEQSPVEDDGTLYRTSDEIEAEYPNWLEGTTTDSGKHSTQVEGTRKTYKKVGDWIEENLGKDVAILDASSGMGYGTADLRERGFNIEDVEPYQSDDRKLNNPATYSSYDDIDTQYDYIISNAVLNVIPDDWRAGVLHSMAEKLKDGGRMFINTRKAGEEKFIKDKIELDSTQEVLVKRNGRIASYQRFFTPQELKEWVESELGDSYTVEVANKANSGTSGLAAVVVTKNNESHSNGKIYSRAGVGSYTDDELAFESDPISKALGKPRGTRKQRREVAERERQRMVDRVEKLAKKLNLDNVEVVTDASTLEGKKQRAKGFYTKSTGKITIVIPNHSSTFDVEQTLLHEAVAHYGLRQLFGEHFDTFLDNVFNNADDAIRQRIVSLAAKNGWDFHKATEEYLAMLAENTEFENTNASWWMKIKDFFLDMLHKIGFEDFRRVTLTDNELRYILWRSYENLAEPGRYRSILGEARDIAMQYDLNVGNYSIKEVTTMDESTRVAGDTNDVMFREEEFSPRDRVTARDAYEQMVSSGSYQFQEAVQDSMLGLKKLYEAVLGKNMRIEDVAGFENAYLAENRMSSENCAEQHEYFVRFLKPLLNTIYKISGTDENMRQELIDYMMAKHGLERNKIMAQRDFDSYKKQYPKGSKTLEDFRERDYAGLTALTGEEDVLKAEESAKNMIDSYESKNVVDELWRRVNDATSATLSKIYASGLLSKERYDQIKSMYEYYIPLQGWDETTSDEIYGYLTSKDGPLGSSPIRRAYGRSSKADDPIATIAKMADDAIRQGNRNLMKQTFLNFVLNNPNDLVSVSDMWLKYDEVSDEWVPVFADINNGDSSSDVERKIREFESKMQELEKNNPDLYKRGNDAENIPYKVVKNNLKEHQILVRRNGRTYVLTINGNPRAAQALNGLTNPDVDTSGIVGNLLRGAQWINRNLSSAYTTRNPEFVASNFLRDMLYSNCMAWVKESPTYAIRFHKNFGKLNPVTMYKLIKKWENGTLNESDYTDRMFNQFMLNGGDTGYTNIKDIEGHKKEIAKQLKDNASNVRKAWSWIGEQLDMFNGSAEDCARFAAFITSRQMGRSIERSIYDAKEISVNFNKKGSGGKMVNATGQTTLGKIGSYVSGTGRLAYVFWNAGIQGTTNFARAAKRNPSKAIAGAACMFTLGTVIPMLAKLMSGGDDDDKDAYYNLPEYIRRSNIALNAGDQWITIPLPIEFRMFYGLGELACGVITRNERYSDSELAYQIASLASQILPLDMLEGGGGINPFIPSSVKSGVEAYVLNKSWSGLPIYKDTPWNKNEPEWTKAYKNANTFLVSSSKWLNDISGGDDHKKGYIDINPAQVEYVLKGVFGGAYTTIDKLAKMGETAVGDRQFEWQNMLIASRMVRTGDERTEAKKLKEEYFKYKDSYEETKRLLKRYSDESEKDERYQKKLESLKKTNDYLIYDVFGNFNPLLKALNDAKEGSSEETIKGIENEENALRREMINLIHDIEDDKNPDIDERVDDMLKREFDYGNISRDKAGDVIANRLGGMDSYGSPQNEYGNIYKNIRDYVDLAEDVSLQVELKQAKDAGDDMRARTIENVRRTITNVKKRLEKAPYKLEDGTEVTDSDVMEELRRIRRNAIEELGISYPYKINR